MLKPSTLNLVDKQRRSDDPVVYDCRWYDRRGRLFGGGDLSWQDLETVAALMPRLEKMYVVLQGDAYEHTPLKDIAATALYVVTRKKIRTNRLTMTMLGLQAGQMRNRDVMLLQNAGWYDAHADRDFGWGDLSEADLQKAATRMPADQTMYVLSESDSMQVQDLTSKRKIRGHVRDRAIYVVRRGQVTRKYDV